jgi:hypothetical protein
MNDFEEAYVGAVDHTVDRLRTEGWAVRRSDDGELLDAGRPASLDGVRFRSTTLEVTRGDVRRTCVLAASHRSGWQLMREPDRLFQLLRVNLGSSQGSSATAVAVLSEAGDTGTHGTSVSATVRAADAAFQQRLADCAARPPRPLEPELIPGEAIPDGWFVERVPEYEDYSEVRYIVLARLAVCSSTVHCVIRMPEGVDAGEVSNEELRSKITESLMLPVRCRTITVEPGGTFRVVPRCLPLANAGR